MGILSQQTGPIVAGQYENPLPISTANGHAVENCADPAVIRSQSPGDTDWYLYCTSDRSYDGSDFHWIPVSRSSDLTHWTYINDVFPSHPLWINSSGGAWAPEVKWLNGQYYLYYTASSTNLAPGGSAIFVATSNSPAGPWHAYSEPVIEPQGAGRWVYDPAVIAADGHLYIAYGSFHGGIALRELTADGLHSLPQTEVPLTTSDRYEGAYILPHEGYYYLMMSASDCCRGPLTGYGVFAARSTNIQGPYLDADGVTTLDSRVGGTPVLAMNGNQWLGTGHHTITTDAQGQDWIIYHAVDVNHPYFSGGLTRRPALIDRLDWANGWPEVRNGAGASNTPRCSPAVDNNSTPCVEPDTEVSIDHPGTLVDADDFDAQGLSASWNWVRPPASSTFSISNGWFQFQTQETELQPGSRPASILNRAAPDGDFMVETRISTNMPLSGPLPFVQGGLLIFKDDENYVKLVEVAIGATRQVEFGKRVAPVPLGNPTYGTSVLSSPADTTYLRIVRHVSAEPDAPGAESYTAYSSHDGVTWHKGSTWRHTLGTHVRIGLVSMGGSGYTTSFDYVHVFRLQ